MPAEGRGLSSEPASEAERDRRLGNLGERLSKVLADGDSGSSDWWKPELVVESVA
jgi:hypothetical protein